MTLLTIGWIGVGWLVIATLAGMVIGKAIKQGEMVYRVDMHAQTARRRFRIVAGDGNDD